MDAGQVEEVKQATIKAIRAEYEPVVVERDQYKSELFNERIGGAFARSPFIVGDKSKVIAPSDMMQAMFGNRFKVEGGKTVPMGLDGKPMFSQRHPGEVADFDEGLELMVEAYPNKAAILRSTGASGGGARGAGQSGGGGAKQMTRAQFDALDPMARAAAVKGGTAIV